MECTPAIIWFVAAWDSFGATNVQPGPFHVIQDSRQNAKVIAIPIYF